MGPDPGHRAGGGEKTEGGHQHLVARADAERHQGEHQGVGAGGDPERVPDPEESGAVLLKGLETGAHDELIRMEHLAEGRGERRFQGAILRAKIKERDVRHGAASFSHQPP